MATVASSAEKMVSPPPPPASTTQSMVNLQFACNASGCNETFSSSAKLTVHKQKHQMTLKLGPSKTGMDLLPVDQTPTPTKFLQFGKELNLFDELNNNNANPFDSEFNKGTTHKEVGGTVRQKALRAGIPGLTINNNRLKTSTSSSYTSQFDQPQQPIAQPVHVITLTPTLTSPVASLPGGQFFVPHIPSPQALLPSGLHIPALGGNSPLTGSLISPSIMPFSPVHLAAVEAHAQRAVLAQAFMTAAAAANQVSTNNSNSMEHNNLVMRQDPPTFPTHTVSVPVANAPTPPHISQSQMSESMHKVQDVPQRNHEQQRHVSMQDDMLPMDVKPFPAVTSVITQAPHNHQHQQHSLPSLNDTMRYQFLMQQQQINQQQQQQMHVQQQQQQQHFVAPHAPPSSTPHNAPTPPQNMGSRANSHPNLSHTVSDPMPAISHSNSFDMNQQNIQSSEAKKSLTVSHSTNSTSSGHGQTKSGRRRGRASSNLDPDEKRQRFLERNRAAASRCRAKKKVWVVDLEIKAKELNNSNVTLQSEVVSLREEVASLKQLLLAHRDCPITRLQQQKLQTAGMENSGNVMISNPVAAAASLLGLSNSAATSNVENDIKPFTSDSSAYHHAPLTHTTSSGSNNDGQQSVQTSVLVNTKMEPMNYNNSDDMHGSNNTHYSSSASSVSS